MGARLTPPPILVKRIITLSHQQIITLGTQITLIEYPPLNVGLNIQKILYSVSGTAYTAGVTEIKWGGNGIVQFDSADFLNAVETGIFQQKAGNVSFVTRGTGLPPDPDVVGLSLKCSGNPVGGPGQAKITIFYSNETI